MLFFKSPLQVLEDRRLHNAVSVPAKRRIIRLGALIRSWFSCFRSSQSGESSKTKLKFSIAVADCRRGANVLDFVYTTRVDARVHVALSKPVSSHFVPLDFVGSSFFLA